MDEVCTYHTKGKYLFCYCAKVKYSRYCTFLLKIRPYNLFCQHSVYAS